MSDIYLGNPNLKKANTQTEFTEDHIKEFLKCNTLDILVPNNNGLDTLTVRSVLDYLKVDYKLFDIEKLD